MTLTNTSHVETIYKAEKDTVISKMDMVEWDFGEGKGNHTPAGESGIVEFPAEGGTFPVTITAWEKNCSRTQIINVVVPAIGEVVTDTTVYRCPGYDYYFEGKNADGTVVRNDKPYSEVGVYQDTLISSIGCDSIIRTTLDVLKPTIVGGDKVILKGDTLHFHGQILTQTGLYRDTLRSIHGCDSIIDTVSLYVHEYIQVLMPPRDSTCSDADEWAVSFLVLQGRSCASYSLTWEDKSAMLPEVDHAPLPKDSIIHVAIPDKITPNYYQALFTFHDSLRYVSPETIKDVNLSITLALLYPDEVITQRWNDVLAIRNEDFNGGYKFDSVQWYLNGQAIAGAKDFNYYTGDGAKLHLGETYTAQLWYNGVAIFSCPFIPTDMVIQNAEMPSLVPPSTPLKVPGKGTASWYDTLGRPYRSEAYDDSDIMTPGTRGYYLLVLQSSDARTVHPIIVK
jgi:hypothetical protein